MGEISNWAHLTEVELITLGKGVNRANLRVASFTTSGGSAFITPREPERTRIFQQEYPPKEARPYYFENAYELLDAQGEWYLNTTTNEVFYLPRDGENMGTAVVMVPVTEQLWNITDTLGAKAHHITLYGLFFEFSTWLSPNSNGFIGDQSFTEYVGPLPEDEIASYSSVPHPAAVHLESATDIRLERNVFRHLGASALNLWMGTSDVVILGNRFTDVAATGVAIDSTYTDAAVIEHNEVSNAPYSGISMGWGWANQPNSNQDNLVRYNEVSNVLHHMSDGGGIYTLSRQTDTLVAENYVHDIVRTSLHGGFGMNCIYLDNGSNDLTVRDNVLVTCGGQAGGSPDDGPLRQNDNGGNVTLINNNGTSSTTIANAGLEAAFADVATDLGETDPADDRGGRRGRRGRARGRDVP